MDQSEIDYIKAQQEKELKEQVVPPEQVSQMKEIIQFLLSK